MDLLAVDALIPDPFLRKALLVLGVVLDCPLGVSNGLNAKSTVALGTMVYMCCLRVSYETVFEKNDFFFLTALYDFKLVFKL